jgi:hypothetical protein
MIAPEIPAPSSAVGSAVPAATDISVTSAASDTLPQAALLPTADSGIDSKIASGESLAKTAGTDLVSSLQNGNLAAGVQYTAVRGQSNKEESIHTQQSVKGSTSRSASSIGNAKASSKSPDQSPNAETTVAQVTQPAVLVQTSPAVPAVAVPGLGYSGLAASGVASDVDPLLSSQSTSESASLSSSAALGEATNSASLTSLDTAVQSGILSAQSGTQASNVNPASILRQPFVTASSSVTASAHAVSANSLSADGTFDDLSGEVATSVQTGSVQVHSGAATSVSMPASTGDLAAATVIEPSNASRSQSSRAQSSDISTQNLRKSRAVSSGSSDTGASVSIQTSTAASSSSYSEHAHTAVSAATNDTATLPVQHVTGLADASRYSFAPSATGGDGGAHASAASLPSTNSSGSASNESAQTSAQSTFSALDADSSSAQPVWTHASARHAEAGYLDPNLGWVGVRADLDGHAVRATVLTSSTDAAQTLSQHMSSLGTYLQEQNSVVRSIGLASSTGQDLQSGTQPGAGQGGSDSGNSSGSREDRSASSSSVAELDVRTISTSSLAGTGNAVPALREGSRISLVA